MAENIVINEITIEEEIPIETRIGLDGTTFTPHITEVSPSETLLSFTNDGGKTNPNPTNIKGEAFSYEDFTPEQILILQKPAIDAAEIATEATNDVLEAEEVIQANEIVRNSAETGRISNETLRNNNESTRNHNEQNRNSAEELRVSSENTRITNESTRQSNETTRLTNEGNSTSGRVKAENDRVAAEIIREEVKEDMLELNFNPPKLIDINGRLIWHYWDLDTHAYVSSGLTGSLNWRGTYSGTETYLPLDVVSYNESTWLCITESTGNLPTTAYFVPLAKGSYQYWLEAGNTGTYEEYLLWLDSKEPLLPATPDTPELKFLNGLRQWATIAIRHNQLSDPNGDENYQHVTKEAQTFDGVKTFEDSPIVPTPTQNTEVANKKYVDDADALINASINALKVADTKQQDSIQQIENTLNAININQEATVTLADYGTLSLPKTAANGGMNVKLEGLTAENLIVNGNFENDLAGWNTSNNCTIIVFDKYVGTKSLRHNVSESTSVCESSLISCNISDKLYAYCYAKGVSGNYAGVSELDAVGIRFASPYSIAISSLRGKEAGIWHRLSGIWMSDSTTTNLYIGQNNSLYTYDVYIDAVVVINLTATFGAGNEPDLATCDKMFANYFDGVKHFEAQGRIKSGNTALYINSPVLRSNGSVKDEIRKGANGYEHVKRVGIATLGVEKVVNGTFDTDTSWTKQTGWTISGGTANFDALQNAIKLSQLISLIVGKKYRISFTVVSGTARLSFNTATGDTLFTEGELLNNYPVGSYTLYATASATNGLGIFAYNTGGGTAFSIDSFSVKEIVGQEPISSTSTFTSLTDGTVLYTLATSIITPIAYGGLLNSNSNGTVYREKVIADAGVYSDKLSIQLTDYPISSFENIIKRSNGVETILNNATAVIAANGLSFTHPDLVSGDLVLFTYYFANESTEGKTTLTYYDSRYVIADTENGKFYKTSIRSANGVASIILTEV